MKRYLIIRVLKEKINEIRNQIFEVLSRITAGIDFPEDVAETLEEAEEFLDDCMAVVCKNLHEVREYFDEAGTDIAGMSDDELLEASEVFELPSGRFLIVEG